MVDSIEGDADASSEPLDTVDATSPPDTVDPEDTGAAGDTGQAQDAVDISDDTGDGGDSQDDVAPECVNAGDCSGSVAACEAWECVEGACTSVAAAGPCDDGDPCTTNDACDAGVCVGRAWTATESGGWIASFDGPGTDMANALVVHPSGDVSVVGSFEGVASLAGTTRTARGDDGHPDAFIARLDAAGATKWVAQAGGDELDAALYAAADGEDLLVAGWFTGAARFGQGAAEVTVTADDELGQSFIARYGAGGALSSVRRTPGFVRALAVAPDGSHDILVLGVFSGTVEFSATGGPVALTSVGGRDYFVARISAAGPARWVARVGSSGDDGSAEGLVTPQVAMSASGDVAVVLDIAESSATYRVGSGMPLGLGANVADGVGFAQVLLSLDLDGNLLGVSTYGDLSPLRFVTSLSFLPDDTTLLVTGGEVGILADGNIDPDGVPPRLFAERRGVGASGWTKVIAGSASLIGTVPLVALGARYSSNEVLVLGSFDGGDVIFDFGLPLSPAASADGSGPRLFLARYSEAGDSLGGVASPGGGAVPLSEWPHRVGLTSVGPPTIVIPTLAVTPKGGACVPVPVVREDGTYEPIPGAPWTSMAVTPSGDAGAAYCIAAARVLGCVVE